MKAIESSRLLKEASRNASILDRHVREISGVTAYPEILRQAAIQAQALAGVSEQLRLAFDAANKLDSTSSMLLTPNTVIAEIQKQVEWTRGFRATGALELSRQLVETSKVFREMSKSPLALLAKQVSEVSQSYNALVSAPQAALKELNESLKAWRELRSELFAPRWTATLQALPALPSIPKEDLPQSLTKSLSALVTTQQPFEALLARTETVQSVYKLSLSLRQQVLNRYAIEVIHPFGSDRGEYRDQLDSEVEEIETRVQEDLEVLLHAIDPSLVEILRGARERIKNKGKDWVRQTLVSLRELSTHVLHLLAPDDKVEAYRLLDSCGPEIREKDGRGKPTRSARLYVIYRDIHHAEMREFLKADVKAALALFDLLNAGTHRMMSAMTEREVTSILRKVESTLQFLIESSE